MEHLAQIAAQAAREALQDWSPNDADAGHRLAEAIGQAVAAAIQQHEVTGARHIAYAMAGIDDAAEDNEGAANWQV